jgi:predicted ATP-grasp superfamily ATP-dependent carboligase
MRKLTILGASVRAAAQAALRAGFAPYAIDLFADRDLAATCPSVRIGRYPQDFLTALAAAPDGPWMYTGGLENFPQLVDRLAEIRPLLGNRGDVLRAVRDPSRLARAVRSAGIPFPETPIRSAAETWLIKPRRSSGGHRIRFALPEELLQPPRGTYLQRYVEGEASSAVFIAAGGRAILLGVSRQLLGRDFGLDAPFLYVGSIAPLLLRPDERAKLEMLANTLAATFGLTGLFNVDFVRTADDLWPVEVNPRYSASVEILERITAMNFVALHVAAFENRSLPACITASPRSFAGKAVVYARRSGVTPPALDELVNRWNQTASPPLIADLSHVGEPIRAGQPVVTVFAEGTADAEASLRSRVAQVQQALANIDDAPRPERWRPARRPRPSPPPAPPGSVSSSDRQSAARSRGGRPARRSP